jgi:hypothetical protein
MVTESVYPLRKDGKPDRRYLPHDKSKKLKNPRNKADRAPRGKRWCTYHKEYEPKKDEHGGERFPRNVNNRDGFDSRCKQAHREYKISYEQRYGDRNKHTKGLRISNKAYEILKTLVEQRGDKMQNAASTAIKFWAEYGCCEPDCTRPRGARWERCDEHVLALFPPRGDRP